MSDAGKVGSKRIGGDDPQRGQQAIAAIEQWRRKRDERRGRFWLRKLMEPVPKHDDEHDEKEA